MIIKNAYVYKEDYKFYKDDIFVSNSKITQDNCDMRNTSSAEEVIDASGLYAIPGLIDIHFHGCRGYDFCDGTIDALDEITRYQGKNGVTAICPATMSLPEYELAKIMKTAKDYDNKEGAILCGINMEGPFISKEKKGAQYDKYIIKPNLSMYRRLKKISANMIKLVEVAPEEEGAMDFIQAVKDEVVVSIAHTVADYDTAIRAFKAGAKHVTHFYNAMPPFSHREPGVIGAASDTKDIYVELICDGVHIHPSVVRATFNFMTDERIVLISDSMEATGMPDGRYMLGGQEVILKGNKPTLAVDGSIAGSATNLMDCMRNLVKNMGVTIEQAVKTASVNPAKAIGVFDEYGSLEPGKIANIVLLDQELNIKAVYIKGKRYV